MPRIPRKVISKDPYIAGFQLAMPRVSDIGVARARPTRVISPGKEVLAGALEDVSGALKSAAEFFAVREEATRVAKSQRLQIDINDSFRDLKSVSAKRTSDQVVGMLDEFREGEEEFRTSSIPDDLDAKTTKELTHQFNLEYNKHAAWIVSHTIEQSNIADKEARIRTIQNAHQNIASFTVGDSTGLEQEITTALNFEIARHPNLTENQIETNRRALREEFVTFALTKWAIDNPTATVTFWDGNQKYLKKALPKMYPTLSQKIDTAREDSAYDTALLTVRQLTKGDNALAAKLIEEDDAGVFKLTAKQRLHLASTLRGIHTYEIAEEERIRRKKEENYLVKSHEKYFNSETGVTNVRGALADLEQALREDIVDSTTYTARKNQLLLGEKFSAEDSHNLMRLINDQEITTKGEILSIIQGTGARPEPYFQELKKRQDEIVQGFTDNWFAVAYTQFTDLAKITKPKDLPSKIAEKNLLIDINKLPDYKRDLEAEARRLGYTAGDPRISKLAKEFLVAGWYSATRPEFHPGTAPWYVVGEEYLRQWDYNAEQLLEKGKIEFLPEKRIAPPVVKDIVLERLMSTPEGHEAYTRLGEYGITVTATTLQQAIDRIAFEKRGKE